MKPIKQLHSRKSLLVLLLLGFFSPQIYLFLLSSSGFYAQLMVLVHFLVEGASFVLFSVLKLGAVLGFWENDENRKENRILNCLIIKFGEQNLTHKCYLLYSFYYCRIGSHEYSPIDSNWFICYNFLIRLFVFLKNDLTYCKGLWTTVYPFCYSRTGDLIDPLSSNSIISNGTVYEFDPYEPT